MQLPKSNTLSAGDPGANDRADALGGKSARSVELEEHLSDCGRKCDVIRTEPDHGLSDAGEARDNSDLEAASPRDYVIDIEQEHRPRQKSGEFRGENQSECLPEIPSSRRSHYGSNIASHSRTLRTSDLSHKVGDASRSGGCKKKL